MENMKAIDSRTKDYAAARAVLAYAAGTLEGELEIVRRRHAARLEKAIGKVVVEKNALFKEIDQNRSLFVKPKTRILQGIKVGLVKGRGSLKFALDPDKIVRLIRRHLSEQVETLIKVSEEPVKSAMGNLTAGELKKIGVTVGDSGEEVVIKSTASGADKLIDALLAAAECAALDQSEAAAETTPKTKGKRL